MVVVVVVLVTGCSGGGSLIMASFHSFCSPCLPPASTTKLQQCGRTSSSMHSFKWVYVVLLNESSFVISGLYHILINEVNFFYS